MADSLYAIESRITQLLQQDKYRWQELAQLAMEVRQQELYLEKGLPSFTAWVRAIAQAANRQPSLFWRYLKAASYYLRQTDSDDLDLISDIKAAPEALDRLEKIERQAPRPIFEAMRDKVLAGEATVAECREVEKQYRPSDPLGNLNNRGRPTLGNEGSYGNFGKWRKSSDRTPAQQKGFEETLSRERATAALQSSLESYAAIWTKEAIERRYPPRNHRTHSNIVLRLGDSHHRLEQITIARWDLKQPKVILGAATRSCLADFEADSHWEIYRSCCHYFSFAIPKQDVALRQAILDQLPSHIGILAVDLDATPAHHGAIAFPVSIIRQPRRTEPDQIGQLYEALYEDLLDWNSKSARQEH